MTIHFQDSVGWRSITEKSPKIVPKVAYPIFFPLWHKSYPDIRYSVDFALSLFTWS